MMPRPSIEGFNVACDRRCKFAPSFSITSGMLLPQLLSFQTLALLPGGGRDRIFHFHLSISVPLSPLECALMSKHRVLPCFGRSCPSVTSLESALTQIVSVNPLECPLTKKGGEGVCLPSRRMLIWAAGEWPQRTRISTTQAVVARQVKQLRVEAEALSLLLENNLAALTNKGCREREPD